MVASDGSVAIGAKFREAEVPGTEVWPRSGSRGDRTLAMARLQATLVHGRVVYDMAVDTTDSPSTRCATGRTWRPTHPAEITTMVVDFLEANLR